jgi:rhamnose transport system permease protein
MAGCAAIVYLGFFGSVQADAAGGSELIDVVTAVVLGGVNIFGGSGSIPGVLLATILVAELRNGMQLDNLSGATQDMVIGGLLLAAILAGNLVRAAHGRALPWRTASASRKGVVQVEGVPAGAKLNSDQGG